MINTTYNVYKTKADNSKKLVMVVFAYKVDGNTIRTVRVVDGKKTAKAENFTVNDFKNGIRLGSAVAV